MIRKNLALAVVLSLPLVAFAGSPAPGPGGKHPGPGGHMERMAKELNLTEEQKPKVESLMKEQHEKMKALHDETHEKLKQLLTQEQASKLDKMKEERKQHWKNRRGQPGDEPEPAEVPN